MKVIAAFLIAISLVLMVACNGGEGDSFRQDPRSGVVEDPAENSFDDPITQDGVVLTEQGAYHDAIDNTPAVDPVEREAAYFAVARALAESESYLPTPNRDVVFDDRWIDDDAASFIITGIFPDPTGEGEKSAVFTIERNPQGFWYPESVPDFRFTKGELNQRRDLERIEEYTAILEVFDAISVSVVSSEIIPAEAFERKYFTVQIDNPTNEDHEVGYMLQWTVTSEDSRCKDPEEKKSGREKIAASSAVSVEVEVPTNLFGVPRHCGNPWLENVRVAIASIDGDVREKIEQRLAELQSQTSPP